MGGQVLSRNTHWGPRWTEKAPKVSRALFQQAGKLGKGFMSCFVVGQMKKLVGCQGYSNMVAMLPGGFPGGFPGGMLGYPAGVIKPSGAVLVVLVGVVQEGGSDESHLLISLKDQSIHSSCFQMGVNTAGSLIQACQKR